MTNGNTQLLDAVSTALSKEFQKRFLKNDFSTTEHAFQGRPKKMHGCLSKLLKADGSINLKAVSQITRRAISALHQIKGKRRLRFYSAKDAQAPAKAVNVSTSPPARIALHRNEIGILFHIRAYA